MKTFEKGQWLYAEYNLINAAQELIRFDRSDESGIYYSESYLLAEGVLSEENEPNRLDMWVEKGSILYESLTPATEEQRNEMLLRVAEAKGFVKGANFTWDGIMTYGVEDLLVDSEGFVVAQNCIAVYDGNSHQWATIIKDEADGESDKHQITNPVAERILDSKGEMAGWRLVCKETGRVYCSEEEEYILCEEVRSLRAKNEELQKQLTDSDLKEFTKAAMQGILANRNQWSLGDLSITSNQEMIARTAISIAKATLSELKKG